MDSFKFANLQQTGNQSIDSFVTDLKQKAKLCEFSCVCGLSYEERTIKDRIILGIHDNEIQKRLLRDDTLIVSEIIKYIKSMELSKK